MTKFLIIGDPHFQEKNSVKVRDFINKICNVISSKKEDLDAIVILGDLLHRHNIAEIDTLVLVDDFIDRISKDHHTYIIVGNHDRPHHTNYLDNKHAYNAYKKWKNITIVDTVKDITINDDRYIFVPYVDPGKFKEAMLETLGEDNCMFLTNTEEDPNPPLTIFCHQEFKGAKMNKVVSKNGDEWEEDLPFVIAGHIHGEHWLSENIYYPGTPMQHTFGEKDNKGVVIYDTDNGDINKIDLKMRKKITIKVDVSDLEDNKKKREILDDVKKKMKRSDVRLKITGDKADIQRLSKDAEISNLTSDNKDAFKISYVIKYSVHELARKGNQLSYHEILKDIVNKDGSKYDRKVFNQLFE